MITAVPTETRAGYQFIRAAHLRRLIDPDASCVVTILGAGRARTRVRTSFSHAQFGGERMWLVCPFKSCRRRVAGLYLVSGKPLCRVCANVRSALYEKSRRHGRVWWERWGRAALQLSKIRTELARPYLRLARRGKLEREEKLLVLEILSGLTT